MRLAVSILVLAMTIPASASYWVFVSPAGGVEFNITVTSDGLDPDEYWALAIEPGATLSNVTIGPDAPSLSANWGTIAYNGLSGYLPGLTGYVGPFATAAGETKQSGTYLTALATWEYGAPNFYLYSFDNDLNFTFEDGPFVAPEPSTIALLGLGALLLRKRRRVKCFNR